MPLLDGLRGIAVLAVLLSHWVPQANRLGHIGLAGVYVFFVLSGFLITRILLEARDARDAGETTLGHALRSFFGRRVLRIFPAYYFALIASVLLWPRFFAADLPWNLAYLGNMRAFLLGRTTAINHFWSLAVEEQFYLFWPFLVLLWPRRDLLKAVAIAVAISPLWRCFAVAMGWRHTVDTYPVWSNLDSIGLGALLAVGRTRAWARTAGEMGGVLWAACGAATIGYLGTHRLSHPSPVYAAIFVVYPLAVSMTAAYLVARAATPELATPGAGRWFATVLGSRALRFIGTISYGVYVYHFFVQGIVDLASVHLAGDLLPAVLRPAAYLAATIAFASLSWFLLERPVRAWGRRFQLTRHRSPS